MFRMKTALVLLLCMGIVAIMCGPAFGYGSLAYYYNGQVMIPKWFNTSNIPWYIDAGAAGSYQSASQACFNNWQNVSYTDISFQYQGTTSIVMDADDGVNVVSYNSNYINWGGVLGFTMTYQHNSTGEIYGFDCIMNPQTKWSTDGTPRRNQYELEAVLTHELGHAQGLSHSVTATATMYPFISAGDAGPASLADDDIIGHALLYGNSSFPGPYAKITGSVTHGGTGAPVAGAAVQTFIQNASTYADNVTSVYTYSDGQYELYVPAGTWLLRLDPLDGDPTAYDPTRINEVLTDIAQIGYDAEWWNTGENNCEDPTLATAITVSAGQTASGYDLVTNENCSGGQAPVADFSGSPTSGTAPLSVNFTDLSSGNPDTWSWDFGDGGSSTAQNPSHTYQNAGSYTVALTAANTYGSDTNTKTNYITVTTGGGGATIHVADITVTYSTHGPNYKGVATVTIVDQNGSGYANATVSGYFDYEGPSSIISGLTDGSGQVTLQGGNTKNPSAMFCFNVTDVSASGATYDAGSNVVTSACSGTVAASAGRPGGSLSVLPTTFSLQQNVPNPFNPTTNISFTLASASRATLEVFDISGRKVATLADGFMSAGLHTVSWDASRSASGVYFYRLKATDFTQTRKMVLLK